MSPVDQAGPVTLKNWCVHMRRWTSQVTEISVSTTKMRIFSYDEHSSLGIQDETKWHVFALYIFLLQKNTNKIY